MGGELLATKIILGFFIVCGAAIILALAIIGLSFLVMAFKRLNDSECDYPEYAIYLKKGYVLRYCYGFCVAADTILIVIEIAATGIGTFIVLIPDTPSYLVAIMLITTFIASSLRSALNLKNNRKGYASAFRVLEFALDTYRISSHTFHDKQKLIEANIKAQQIISDFNE